MSKSQEPSGRRRGRPPSSESKHPLGRLIRGRRLARNWSIARLAEEVGIGQNSISLISEIERGTRTPSLEVAEKLAQVLDIPAGPLMRWAETRRTPRSTEQLRYARLRYEREDKPKLERDLDSTPQLSLEWDPRPIDDVAHVHRESEDDIPVLAAGTDPDARGARPLAYLARRHLPTSLAGALVQPVAFVVSDGDFDRLRRPIYEDARPRYAIVTRPGVRTIDPREPYAVRRHGRIELAYVAWNGRELLILPPPGKGTFQRAAAEGPRGLERRLVGQVVAMLGWSRSGSG